jgi:predicted transcriptional regulator
MGCAISAFDTDLELAKQNKKQLTGVAWEDTNNSDRVEYMLKHIGMYSSSSN